MEKQGINDWLSALLARGALPTQEVTARAKLAGYKHKDLKRARVESGIQTINVGSGVWLWALPTGKEYRAHVHQD